MKQLADLSQAQLNEQLLVQDIISESPDKSIRYYSAYDQENFKDRCLKQLNKVIISQNEELFSMFQKQMQDATDALPTFLQKEFDFMECDDDEYYIISNALLPCIEQQQNIPILERVAKGIFIQLIEAFFELHFFEIDHYPVCLEHIGYLDGKIQLQQYGFEQHHSLRKNPFKNEEIYLAPEVEGLTFKKQKISTREQDMFNLGQIMLLLLAGYPRIPRDYNNLSKNLRDLLDKMTLSHDRLRMKWQDLMDDPYFQSIQQEPVERNRLHTKYQWINDIKPFYTHKKKPIIQSDSMFFQSLKPFQPNFDANLAYQGEKHVSDNYDDIYTPTNQMLESLKYQQDIQKSNEIKCVNVQQEGENAENSFMLFAKSVAQHNNPEYLSKPSITITQPDNKITNNYYNNNHKQKNNNNKQNIQSQIENSDNFYLPEQLQKKLPSIFDNEGDKEMTIQFNQKQSKIIPKDTHEISESAEFIFGNELSNQIHISQDQNLLKKPLEFSYQSDKKQNNVNIVKQSNIQNSIDSSINISKSRQEYIDNIKKVAQVTQYFVNERNKYFLILNTSLLIYQQPETFSTKLDCFDHLVNFTQLLNSLQLNYDLIKQIQVLQFSNANEYSEDFFKYYRTTVEYENMFKYLFDDALIIETWFLASMFDLKEFEQLHLASQSRMSKAYLTISDQLFKFLNQDSLRTLKQIFDAQQRKNQKGVINTKWQLTMENFQTITDLRRGFKIEFNQQIAENLLQLQINFISKHLDKKKNNITKDDIQAYKILYLLHYIKKHYQTQYIVQRFKFISIDSKDSFDSGQFFDNINKMDNYIELKQLIYSLSMAQK